MLFPNHLRSLVEHTLRSFQAPGLIVAVTEQSAAPSYLIAGADAAGVPLREDSLFPVASITKLAVALAVLRLADAGVLSWRDPLARYLPEAAAAQEGVTLQALLTHTSGLPSSYPDEAALYQLGLTWPMIAQACVRTALVQPPDTSVCYSGVGYSLLALVVERVTGERFGTALSDLVLAPLGIEAYIGQEPPRPVAVIDVEQSPFTGTPLEFYNSQFFRTLGEPAGGLLTTAAGALRLISAYQNQSLGFLQAETAAAATRNQVAGLGGGVPGWFTLSDCRWGLGPALAPTFPWVPKQAVRNRTGIPVRVGAWCGMTQRWLARGCCWEPGSPTVAGVTSCSRNSVQPCSQRTLTSRMHNRRTPASVPTAAPAPAVPVGALGCPLARGWLEVVSSEVGDGQQHCLGQVRRQPEQLGGLLLVAQVQRGSSRPRAQRQHERPGPRQDRAIEPGLGGWGGLLGPALVAEEH